MISEPSAARSPRPLIGLSGRTKSGAEIAGFPRNLATVAMDVYVSDYARAISAAGGLPVHLPQHVDPVEYAGRLDGVLLSGGADVDPAQYGAVAGPDLYPLEPERDRAEMALVEMAVAEQVPVLGICRGLQVLNVWAGGSLHQHVPEHARYDIPASDRVDEIVLTPGTEVHQLYGAHHHVNSLHHQTVDRVAAGWTVSARSVDGTVEALEWPGHDVIAVQWHPELLDDADRDPLFAWFVGRAAAVAAARS